MSSRPMDFKKVQSFWKSLENPKSEPCAYFNKRKAIIETPNAKAEKAQSRINLTKVLGSKLEETKLRKGFSVDLNEESLIDTSTIRETEAATSSGNQCQYPDITIAEYKGRVSPAINHIPCNDTDIQWNILEQSIDENSIEPESDSEFDQKLSDTESKIIEDENQFLSPDNIINDSDSCASDENDDEDTFSCVSNFEPYPTPNIRKSLEVSFFDDGRWLFHKNHIFVLSFAGKPIFSLHGHGHEDKMGSLFALIHCFVSVVEGQKDRISSIEAEGIKFVFLVRNSLYLVATSRENLSEHHLKLQLREVYNRIGFLLTFKKLESIFKCSPGYDLRKQLDRNYRLISNQLVANNEVSNSVFTLFTNTIRILPLPPSLRTTIRKTIKKKCSKISHLASAVLIVDQQLIALVRQKNHPIYPADIRLIFNLMECSEKIFNNYSLNMLPICLPDFNKDCYLHAYISCISEECEAFLILLSYDRNMADDVPKAHREITKSLHKRTYYGEPISKIIQNASQPGNGFAVEQTKTPGLWHFLYIPRSKNQQILCSKITPPYTSLSEFRRLQSIYYDLYRRIHNKSRPLDLIFETKEKEVVLAIETRTAEIYAIFDPLINTVEVAKSSIDELIKSIKWDEDIYFIKNYPKF